MKGVILMGLQASGKSSYYFQFLAKTHLRLNMDMLKTRHREKLLFQACLASKQPVVIDNTNPTKSSRASYIQAFKQHKFEVVGYYFSSHLQDCLERNNQRSGRDKIPEIGVKGTYGYLQRPQYDEGFDQLYYVSIKEDGFSLSEWQDEI